jgi:hypothetical protein
MPTHTSLKGVSQIGDAQISVQLETNIVHFLQWAFLGLGDFAVVEHNASGYFGGDMSRLRPARDPNYTDGQVWEGFRRDWVWETGVECGYQPIRVSGVWVNSSFYPISETGVYKHSVDYPNGRVIFTDAINPSSVVQASFAYRRTHFTTASTPWWRQLQAYSMRVDDPQFLQTASGAWATLSQNRMQLPAVVVEAVPGVVQKPLAMGGGVEYHQPIAFHIITELHHDRNQLHDILVRQWQKRINKYDLNQVITSGVYPLDADGAPNPSGLMYPDLVSYEGGYGENTFWVANVASYELSPAAVLGIYPAQVRWECIINI